MIALVVWILLALIWLADGLRLRGKARALATLPAAGDADETGFRLVVAPGVTVDAATRAGAVALARATGSDVVDLVPADLPSWRLLLLLATSDPARLRASRIAVGRTASHAVLVTDELVERSRAVLPADAAGFHPFVVKLKQHAARMDVAVAPGLRAGPDDPTLRRALLAHLFGDLTRIILVIQLALFGLGLVGPLVTPVAGAIALVLLHLQPVLATAGTALRPRDLAVFALLRTPLELLGIARLAATPPPPVPDLVTPLRPVYAALVADGLGRFFEPRRETCPLCGGAELHLVLETDDLLQQKPGAFAIDRCGSCGHSFQNPRLSLAGLDYYYKDAYDGLNEQAVEALFGFGDGPYLARARAVGQVAKPTHWLDVGGGHGHFAAVAREVFPEAQFDALDLSVSIEDAERRRWVTRGWRGLFPDLAPLLVDEGYDVVSMSHYLEHTRDPEAEIAAAALVLEPGGHLLIEVPDPESRIRHILGRFWVPWFQPQHQHWVTAGNLTRLLAKHGFEPVLWHRGPAHIALDFRGAAFLLLGRMSPGANLPWRPAPSDQDRVLGHLMLWLGMPVLASAFLLDQILAPLFRRPGWSNAYRVVARRRPTA